MPSGNDMQWLRTVKEAFLWGFLCGVGAGMVLALMILTLAWSR